MSLQVLKLFFSLYFLVAGIYATYKHRDYLDDDKLLEIANKLALRRLENPKESRENFQEISDLIIRNRKIALYWFLGASAHCGMFGYLFSSLLLAE